MAIARAAAGQVASVSPLIPCEETFPDSPLCGSHQDRHHLSGIDAGKGYANTLLADRFTGVECTERTLEQGSVMPRVFVSYRRLDVEAFALSVYAALCCRFGAEQVFIDTKAIPPGADFIRTIQHALLNADVLVAVIGSRWAGRVPPGGSRRIHDPEDIVRWEIATALCRGTPVIPLLVDGTPIPSVRDLPPELHGLVRYNALHTTASSFDTDIAYLISAVAKLAGAQQASTTDREVEVLDLLKHRPKLNR